MCPALLWILLPQFFFYHRVLPIHDLKEQMCHETIWGSVLKEQAGESKEFVGEIYCFQIEPQKRCISYGFTNTLCIIYYTLREEALQEI
jgi:hypothetical protein